MEIPVQKGYLVLADISGFTAFLASSEIGHAPQVVQNIISFLIRHLSPVLHVAEVEGDAVFAYASEDKLTRGELLLETVECMFVDFKDAQRTMKHNATCPCRACQSVSSLDLKFVAHHGEYVLQDMGGSAKPVGSAVNLAHRLLKNRVSEETGWSGYVLFTQECLDAMGVCPENMHVSTESYPHLGTVKTNSVDLESRRQEIIEHRWVKLSDEEADVLVTRRLGFPRPIIWDWLNDPVKRNQWMGSAWHVVDRPLGRTGRQTRNHCARSGTIEHVLDWRPFDYVTVRQELGPVKLTITNELEPEKDDTTVLTMKVRLEGSLPRPLLRAAARPFVNHILRVEKLLGRMEDLAHRAPQAHQV